MARTVEDATRFTPNGPYASRPSTRATVLQFSDPAPADETPQQKIARLREAARRAKLAQESAFDKVVTRGRGWADKAHRATVYGIIAFSAITGIVTVFSLTDMVVYNRNKRKEWLASMQEKRAKDVAIARKAYAEGTASNEQMLLLNQERAAEESRLEKERNGGIFKRTKTYFFSGFSKEEKKGGRLAELQNEKESEGHMGGQTQEASESLGVLKATEAHKEARIAQEKRSIGGPLDQTAEQAAQVMKTASRSWTSWITGR